MLPSAAEHMKEVEARERAGNQARQAMADRQNNINLLQQKIAAAKFKMTAPIFLNVHAEYAYQSMQNAVERKAEDYERGLNHSLQRGEGTRLNLSSEGAIAYFFKDLLLEKLPVLADRISSRDGRGLGIDEQRRQTVVAECERIIAESEASLAALGA